MTDNEQLFDDKGNIKISNKTADVFKYINNTEIEEYDRSYLHHRNTSFNSEFLRWQVPGDPKTSEQELVPGIHNFVAVRGVPIEFSFGFSLYDGIEGKKICGTTKYESIVDGEVKTRVSSTPLLFPVFQPHQSREKQTTYNYTMLKAGGVLYGSRKKPDGSLLDCKTCVESRMNVIPSEKGEQLCNSIGQLTFVVFQVGKLEFDKTVGKVYLDWIPVENLGIQTIDRPIVIKINRLSKSSMFNKFGNGEKDLKIQTVDNDKMGYVPSDVMTAGEYYKYIHSDIEKCQSLSNGQAVYFYPTDVYIARKDPKVATSANIIAYPAFRPIDDPDILVNTKEMVNTAWRVYFDEKALAEGKSIPNSKLFSLPPSSNKNKPRAISEPKLISESELISQNKEDDFAPPEAFTFSKRAK